MSQQLLSRVARCSRAQLLPSVPGNRGPAGLCGDCGVVHPTRDTVKQVKGSLVCKVDCGLLPHSSRKGKRLARESADHEPPAPSKRAAPPAPAEVAAYDGAGVRRVANAAVDLESMIQSMTPEQRQAVFAKFSSQEAPPPPIDATNSASYPPPDLYKYRTAASRGPGSEPAVWFKPCSRARMDGCVCKGLHPIAFTRTSATESCGFSGKSGARLAA